MIFDIHAHLMGPEAPGQAFWDGFTRLAAAQTGRSEERIRQRLDDIWDLTGERLIQDLDEAGVDRVMVMPVDWGLVPAFKDATMDIWEQHELHARVTRKYPDRMVAFACFDPRRPNAVSMLERAVKELGMVGLKIHPGAGFFPNDRAVYPMYEKALELGIPVMVHTGPEPKPLYSRHCQPVYVDDVAADFPDLTIILAHAGLSAWWQEAAGIASVAPNVYLDISGWQAMARLRPLEFYTILRSLISTVGARRILWGSDYPALRLLLSESAWVKAITDPPEIARQHGITFVPEEVSAIMGDNAARLLGP
jgi:predicted TIM-barrel fold metal-dependent hydrolase